MEKRRYQLPNGEIIPDYYIVKRGDYILVVAVDERNQVILEEQFRPGAFENVIELPAGWIDEGETVEQAASRELLEETGYEASSTEVLGFFYPLPGIIEEKGYVVLARIDSQKKVPPKQDVREDIQVISLPMEEVKTFVAQNTIKCMGSVAALNLYWQTKK